MRLWSGICGRSEETQLCLILVALRDIVGIIDMIVGGGDGVGEFVLYSGPQELFEVWIR
jgi:hypothetical protein